MKKYKIFDKEKFNWAMDSAFDALYREDKNIFMKRVTDMGLSSEMTEKEYIFCSLKCLEEYFGIEEWCVG